MTASEVPDLDARRDQLRWLFQNFDTLLEQVEPATMSKALQDAGFRLMVEDSTVRVEWE